ncbi:DUF2147 domain-containing protein [Methylobacterium gnaphalii]|uniref:DUF2147 domain-containing protein n=1 Tax=Methylobacterium gnaphalii TaxID=1010610 RepID=A0A512JEY2_9HYPH|nr:DUF2147 domain-containing protein [Methylobacterium gnaphalii]GEP08501.1 hypothetical protein MGN01_03460 [Methylobacterium gnaphalii]GJD71087.1 hypothetical protein MMMDOFMJ_4041 [Methylobacterium gnaphalii]GLS49042.1 hypothetical protein GCM10007885_18900 [Methylobacterium gnaphalii]
MTASRALRSLALAALAMLAAGPGLAQRGGDPSGTWLTESGARVRVARCGGGYCGTLASTTGSGLDVNNPDPALKSRKLVGVQILTATAPSGDGFEGSLYNPNDGKTYSGSMTPKGPDHLAVAGCVLRVLCKSQTWTRVK